MFYFFVKNKQLIISSIVATLCLVLLFFFPQKDIFQTLISNIAFLLVIPVLYTKIVLRKDVGSFWKKNIQSKKHWWFSFLTLITSLALSHILINYTKIFSQYSISPLVRSDFLYFFLYEVLLVGAFVVLYEIFFRAFLISILQKYFGFWSIIVQFLLFFLIFQVLTGYDPNFLPYTTVALFSGIIFYHSQSIIFSICFSLFYKIIFDSLIIISQ